MRESRSIVPGMDINNNHYPKDGTLFAGGKMRGDTRSRSGIEKDLGAIL